MVGNGRSRFTVSLLSLGAALVSTAIAAAEAPPIVAATFDPAGQRILYGSQRGIAAITPGGEAADQPIETALIQVHDLAFSPDSKLLAVAGGNPGESGQVELFRWPSGQLQAHFDAHSDLCYRVVWESDGQSLYTASSDQSVKQIGLEGNELRRLEGHSRAVSSLALAGSATLLTASDDQTLRLWDRSTGELLRTLDNHTAAVHDVSLRPGKYLPPQVASAGADGTVRLWQPTLGRLMRFQRLAVEPLALAWSNDGGRLFAACEDGHVRGFDPLTMAVVSDQAAIDGWAYCVCISPDGRWLFVGGDRGQRRVFSVAEL